MVDIKGTDQADLFDEGSAPSPEWINYLGLGGDDTIVMWQGNACGGPGNDRIEHKAGATSWQQLSAVYWYSPAGVEVDLEAGWAKDGWGTTDTLIGVTGVHGTGYADRLYGSAGPNSFFSQGGSDYIDGRGGLDSVILNAWVNGIHLKSLSQFNVRVSLDGRHATVTTPLDPNLRIELVDVELLAAHWDEPYVELASLISHTDLALQGLLGTEAQRWNTGAPVGSAATVSFSFVESATTAAPSGGFRAFSASERQVVRDLLAGVSGFTGLRFSEVAEAGGAVGQLRFGVSQQAATKGLAYAPGMDAAAGDVWMDVESMRVLTPGSEGHAALLHEIGHALGLRHPRNVDATDQWTQQWRVQDDLSSRTVMSAMTSVDGLFRSDWGAFDVTALRHLYGSRAVSSGDDRHVLAATAAGQRTLIDDGGNDVLDASAAPLGVTLDLRPGASSSVGVTAQGVIAVDNLSLGLDTWIESAIGSAHDDMLLGNARANRLDGGLGNDWIDGGGGLDTAVFHGRRADHTLSSAYGYTYVSANDGTSGFDTLVNVERLQFTDCWVALDLDGAAGTVARTLGTVFGAAGAADLGYRGIGLSLLDGGMDSAALMKLALQARLGAGASNAAVVDLLYTNVTGRAPDAQTAAPFIADLAAGRYTQADLGLRAAGLDAMATLVGLTGLRLDGMDYV